MKKLIAIFVLLATPLMAAAESDYTLRIEDQGNLVEPIQAKDGGCDNGCHDDGNRPNPDRTIHRNYNFGTVWVGQRRSTTFFLGAGRYPVRVWGINVSGYFFDGASNCPDVLFPGQECSIRVYYWPNQPGNHYGNLDVWIANDHIDVDLYGRARYRY